ncbi:hypothetical protein [Frankia sp. Mgl5]|nr:hypothetical protein [Frankia sp. Mgl5]
MTIGGEQVRLLAPCRIDDLKTISQFKEEAREAVHRERRPA